MKVVALVLMVIGVALLITARHYGVVTGITGMCSTVFGEYMHHCLWNDPELTSK